MKWTEDKFKTLYAVPSRNGLNRPSRVRGSGYRMVNMGELFANARIGDVPMESVPMSDRELGEYLLEEGDLLFARQSLVLAGAGKCSYVLPQPEPTTFESHLIRVRLDRGKASPLFYHYYFASPYSGMSTIVQQCAQAGIKGSSLGELMVAVPAVSTQQRIAEVLSSYDDLIENNRRRMKLLEDAARQLYEEWFVHLRFPGHERTRIKDGMPEGWERVYLADKVKTQYGFTETATTEEVGPKFLRGTDVNKASYIDWSSVPFCPIDDDAKRKYQLRAGDIVIIRMADPGKVAIIERGIDAVFASYLIRAVPTDKRLTPYYLFYCLSGADYQGFISGVSAKATRKTASALLLVDFHLNLPPEGLVQMFEEAVLPLRQQLTTLLIQNEKLRAARDLLLPRLMSGEVKAN